MRANVRLFGLISVGALLVACGSKPPGTGVTDGAGGDGDQAGQAGSSGRLDGLIDGLVDESTNPTVVCRTLASCEALECGPRPDGCNDFIDCGVCSDPAMTCGGAGVPSFCGVPGTGTGGDDPNCAAETCDSLGASCGQFGDGCGHVLQCGTCSGAGEECVQGTCSVSGSCQTHKTCADYPEAGRCGLVSDGCSGILDCGFDACADNERCGAVVPGFCGVQACEPQSCEAMLADQPQGYCGFVSDGCAGELQGCATVCDANAGESCGVSGDAGAYIQICGTEGGGGGGGGGCVPPLDKNTACQGKCGVIGDGCSSSYDCGNTCQSGESCGLGGPNVCGAVPSCIPATCNSLQAACGTTLDGCGGSLDCGTCSNGETCGGGGIPYQCGAPCQAMDQVTACTQAGANCGLQSNGCSGTVNCGSCSNGETCGGGGVDNQCGSSCAPKTCLDLGATCGPQGDGCNGQLDCGTCGAYELCRGTPSQCVPDLSCTNFCREQVSCSPGQETRVTGKVYAPNGTEPLYNALVYIPNLADLNSLPAISSGASCERCEDEDLGEPLVATVTGPDGSFSLNNVPAGVDFPLVVKMGKWRRVTTISAVAGCSSNVLNANDARLPRHRNDAANGLTQFVNLPKIAMATGKVDAIECVLRKIGVADSEFTAPTGNGRIHLYKGVNGAGDHRDNRGRVRGTSVDSVFQNSAIDNYDMAIFDCEGSAYDHSANHVGLHDYANAGGRVFASHFSYTYLQGNGDFDTTASWGGGQQTETNPTTGIMDQSHPKGQAFNSWLGSTNSYSTTYGSGYISITDPRSYVTAVDPDSTERFVYFDANHVVPGFSGTGTQPNGNINIADAVEQYAFNTPVGAAPDATCGRVVYSAFHVSGQTNTGAYIFPEECNNNPLTAQERVLEFMLFDLSACVSTSAPPSCSPKTCGELSATCGFVSDGCGGLLDCGTCSAPDTCGGGGTANQCGSNCTLTSCAAEGATCGTIGDNCGGTLNCGTCSSPAVCGGGGTANVCGVPACTPRSCQSVGATCGNIGDGCGGTLNCGTCASGQICGGGGANTCGSASCTPTGCGSATCGTVGDGCGNALNCGICGAGSACGAGGANRCGPVCTPQTCQQAGKNCGFIGDGCGGVLDCGTCSEGVVCGGGGTANVCGGNCNSTTCAAENANCGTLSDGCGGLLTCGSCPSGQVCGAQTANQCGTGSCTPTTCGARCGIQSNGCSGTLNCGPCNGCVPYACTPNVDCGPVADGCGGLKDCGVCSNGNTCGGGGVASKCGGGIQ